jgi:hypothetical protein
VIPQTPLEHVPTSIDGFDASEDGVAAFGTLGILIPAAVSLIAWLPYRRSPGRSFLHQMFAARSCSPVQARGSWSYGSGGDGVDASGIGLLMIGITLLFVARRRWTNVSH